MWNILPTAKIGFCDILTMILLTKSTGVISIFHVISGTDMTRIQACNVSRLVSVGFQKADLESPDKLPENKQTNKNKHFDTGNRGPPPPSLSSSRPSTHL